MVGTERRIFLFHDDLLASQTLTRALRAAGKIALFDPGSVMNVTQVAAHWAAVMTLAVWAPWVGAGSVELFLLSFFLGRLSLDFLGLLFSPLAAAHVP